MTRLCHKPKRNSNFYVYEKRSGVWRLMNFGNIVVNFVQECLWCKRDLYNVRELEIKTESHCCRLMTMAERRLNKKNPRQKNRYYIIQWLGSSGWSLLNNNKPIKSKLNSCPFCHTYFPFLNQVNIE